MRVLIGVGGYTAASTDVLQLLLGSVLGGWILDAVGMDALVLLTEVVGWVLILASCAVLAGLLLQWLWLRRPREPGTIALLVALLLVWGWPRLQGAIDLWGFQTYPGSLEWSNPDIRLRLVLFSVVTIVVIAVEIAALVIGSARMLRANRTPANPSGQPDLPSQGGGESADDDHDDVGRFELQGDAPGE
ncbi:MAG TPA: hypothetical protein DCM67_04155 [Propionibacteriaceae bacterium]|nr:hypothetical protein [Propionibacteriaceae bacterium]